MGKSISASAKRRGRPVTTGTGTTIGVRMLDDRIAVLDAWIAKQKSKPSRPEAIRRLVEIGLLTSTTTTDMRYQAKASDSAAKAKKLAGELGLKAKGK
jgi:hypothetical protein